MITVSIGTLIGYGIYIPVMITFFCMFITSKSKGHWDFMADFVRGAAIMGMLLATAIFGGIFWW